MSVTDGHHTRGPDTEHTEHTNDHTESTTSTEHCHIMRDPSPTSATTMLTVTGTINSRRAHILIDSGSSSDFVNIAFVKKHRLATEPQMTPKAILLADGSAQRSTEQLRMATLNIQGHTYDMDLNVLPLRQYDAILGMSWLSRYNPSIDWTHRTISSTATSVTDVSPHIGSPFASAKAFARQFAADDQLFVAIIETTDRPTVTTEHLDPAAEAVLEIHM